MLKNSLINVVKVLLKKNNIYFDKQELAFQIQSHPSYPSLHAITGVLDHFNIDNIAADVSQNSATLLELPHCFLAQIKTNTENELVTVFRKKLNYVVFYSSKKKETISESEFLEKFTGIIVAVEKSETQENQSLNYLNISLLIAFVLVSFSLLIISEPTILEAIFFITSLIGLFISVSIYKQELGVSSVIGNAFCSSTNEKKDCDAVLSSKGATVFKKYKLSDFSLIYFSSITFVTFLIIFKNSSLSTLYILSFITFPFTLYSIYYQFKVVKKWCFLCLSIVGVLWLQATLAFFSIHFTNFIFIESLLIVVFSFSAIFFIWNSLKPILKEFQENKNTKLEHYKFKRNYKLFSFLLKSTKKINTELISVPEIVFGNKNSYLELVIITNPFCGHCKPVHTIVDNILQQYKNEVKVIVRFNIDSKNQESDAVRIASRLIELYNTQEITNYLTAMSQIYDGDSVYNWLNTWGECNEKEKYVNVLEREKFWCTEQSINFTPEILINGQSFPKEYDRIDLIYFIEDLYEDVTQLEKQNENSQFELTA